MSGEIEQGQMLLLKRPAWYNSLPTFHKCGIYEKSAQAQFCDKDGERNTSIWLTDNGLFLAP